MKIVIVSFYEVYPPVCGVANVTYHVAKYLSGETYLIQLSKNTKQGRKNGNLHFINMRQISNNRLVKTINLALHLPFLITKIKQLKPEIVIFESASWVLYYLILFYLMKIARIDSGIIYHAHNVEYLLRKQKNSPVIAFITHWAEKKLLRRCDLSFSVSENDTRAFGRMYGVRPLVLANGVDSEEFDSVTDEEIQKIRLKYHLNGRIVLFMGLPTYKPNKEAIDFLINDVFPIVKRECAEAKLSAIGGHINFENEWFINPGNIPFEEVPAFIKACDVCVAPIFSGSGTRLKILEYLAAGKPVVSTTKGVEGIAVKDGENVILADDAGIFAEKILYLLKNPEVRARIGMEGIKLIKTKYLWSEIIKDFHKTLDASLSENETNEHEFNKA